MAINDKLAEYKGEVEAELAKVNGHIAGNAKTAAMWAAKKVALEAELAEFAANFPAIVAKPVVKPGKVTP
jgi:hypothetical protein